MVETISASRRETVVWGLALAAAASIFRKLVYVFGVTRGDPPAGSKRTLMALTVSASKIESRSSGEER